MTGENEEVLSTTTSEGETGVMVCKTTDEAKRQKVCMEIESAGQTPASTVSTTEKGMLDNNVYNLMEQLTIENKSLWRIKNNYKNDAATDNEAKEFWNFLEKDKEEVVKLLTERLRERL